MRTFAIWIFGLLGSMIVGGMIGSVIDAISKDFYSERSVWGALAGAFTFACLRLWLAAPSKKPPVV